MDKDKEVYCYVGTLVAYQHIVFMLEKFHVKNFAHKQSKMWLHHSPTPGVGRWETKSSFRAPTHPLE